MIEWREGTVRAERARWGRTIEYAVRLADRGGDVAALAYVDAVGVPVPGDRVLLNTTALSRGLGTGGFALVVALPDRLPDDPPEGAGHIVKARYTPLQQVVLAVDEQDSPHHETLRDADDLAGMPVVVADLHSALPAVVAGVRADDPGATVAYVMTDGAALPLTLSRVVAGLRGADWLTASVTVGQAHGGDVEAVTLHTGLLAARHVLGADVAVVAQGPGNVGTGTRWGFSGVQAGDALNAVHVLGGRGIAALRVSQGDDRGRHRGLSHHSRTAYGRVALVPADVPVPRLGGDFGDLVQHQAREMVDTAAAPLTAVDVEVDGLLDALRSSPVGLSTMGRGLEQDPAAFLSSAAAGRWAARLLHG